MPKLTQDLLDLSIRIQQLPKPKPRFWFCFTLERKLSKLFVQSNQIPKEVFVMSRITKIAAGLFVAGLILIGIYSTPLQQKNPSTTQEKVTYHLREARISLTRINVALGKTAMLPILPLAFAEEENTITAENTELIIKEFANVTEETENAIQVVNEESTANNSEELIILLQEINTLIQETNLTLENVKTALEQTKAIRSDQVLLEKIELALDTLENAHISSDTAQVQIDEVLTALQNNETVEVNIDTEIDNQIQEIFKEHPKEEAALALKEALLEKLTTNQVINNQVQAKIDQALAACDEEKWGSCFGQLNALNNSCKNPNAKNNNKCFEALPLSSVTPTRNETPTNQPTPLVTITPVAEETASETASSTVEKQKKEKEKEKTNQNNTNYSSD